MSDNETSTSILQVWDRTEEWFPCFEWSVERDRHTTRLGKHISNLNQTSSPLAVFYPYQSISFVLEVVLLFVEIAISFMIAAIFHYANDE
jgi:hypothetical protein